MAIQDNATAQLGALPFGNIIGGPLVAAIEAQAKAARSTVEYIKSVAYKPNATGVPTDELQTVRFTYLQKKMNETTKEIVFTEAKLEVPLLVIVPIPYIRIDDMTVQFKAKISAETASKDTTNEGSQTETKGNLTGRYGWWPSKVEASFSAGYSAKKDSTSARDSRYSVEYTMDIYVHAVNESMPDGMGKVLGFLNESIKNASDQANQPNQLTPQTT